MREILFRGKRMDNGEWAEGAYCGYNSETPFVDMVSQPNIILHRPGSVLDGFWFQVDPETVGQYTGLTDKNGKKIFEGDLIRDLNGGMDGIPRCVVWDESYMAFHCPTVRSHWAYGNNNASFWLFRPENIEIIGNIHDNPELLGGGGDG